LHLPPIPIGAGQRTRVQTPGFQPAERTQLHGFDDKRRELLRVVEPGEDVRATIASLRGAEGPPDFASVARCRTLAAMGEFALELCIFRTDVTAVRRSVELAWTAAATARYLRSIFRPEDEWCFLFFEASSAAAVGAVADRAGLCARVVEAAAW
jgi:hypothetical protein